MNLILADTFYFLTLWNRDDAAPLKARALSEKLTYPILTTPWVLTEVADALAAQGELELFGKAGGGSGGPPTGERGSRVRGRSSDGAARLTSRTISYFRIGERIGVGRMESLSEKISTFELPVVLPPPPKTGLELSSVVVSNEMSKAPRSEPECGPRAAAREGRSASV